MFVKPSFAVAAVSAIFFSFLMSTSFVVMALWGLPVGSGHFQSLFLTHLADQAIAYPIFDGVDGSLLANPAEQSQVADHESSREMWTFFNQSLSFSFRSASVSSWVEG
jgi:hypothetical protein